jgi:hypothetical protein
MSLLASFVDYWRIKQERQLKDVYTTTRRFEEEIANGELFYDREDERV